MINDKLLNLLIILARYIVGCWLCDDWRRRLVIVVYVRSLWSRSRERLEWSCLTRATCLQSDRSALVTTFCSLLMRFRLD